ncbi:MAG: histidinol-phosphate transaminase [Oscillospiraceae bacterium]|nr:histidinol-phosphate transaminase [Oscillospiraceae bacterium]
MRLSSYLTSMPAYSPAPNTCKIRLNTNESPYDLPDNLRKEVLEKIGEMAFNRYPNPRAIQLRDAAAAFYGVDPSMIMPGNGSGEWIKMLVSDLMEHGSKLLLLDPDFFIYRRQAGFAAIESQIVSKDADGFFTLEGILNTIKAEKPDLFIFSNPCNPTGQGFDKEEVKQIIAACGDAVVIVDEAYNDFYGESIIDYAVTRENVIVLRTCSKAVGIACARVGFAISNPKMIDLINHIRSPYSVSQPAQIIGEVVLKNKKYLKEITAKVIEDREITYRQLAALADQYPDIFIITPSVSNSFFARFKNSEKICDALKERSISVRNFPKAAIPHTRITVGTTEENKALVEALTEILADQAR